MRSPYNILVVEDDPHGAKLLCRGLDSDTLSLSAVHTGKEALLECMSSDLDCILLDLNLPDQNGLDVLRQIKGQKPFCPVIIITGQNQVQTAVQAIKDGAYDYLTKPVDLDNISHSIHRAIQQSTFDRHQEAQKATDRLNAEGQIIHAPDSPLASVMELATKIAPSHASVLISGESGTGKELLARFIHQSSTCSGEPFVVVNCGAIPRELMESEFFGHEKGAFTGADARKEGLFLIADKGTLFLDEIGELPLDLQVKLLRTLQSGEVRRVGGNQTLHVKVRIIAATNKILETEIQEKRFREDLYYRINVVSLNLPPIRERMQDIPCLAEHFLHLLHIGGLPSAKITADAVHELQKHTWPGNIRELHNTLERLLLVSDLAVIDKHLVREDFNAHPRPHKEKLLDENISLAEMEMKFILNTLKQNSGNKARTARQLGISVQTLYNKLNRKLS